MAEIKHLYTFISKEVVVDTETNNLTINSLLDEIQFQISLKELPHEGASGPMALALPFEVTSVYFRDTVGEEASFLTKVEIVDPKGKILNTAELPGSMDAHIYRFRTRLRSDVFPVTESGVYRFKVYMKNGDKEELVGESPIVVKVDKIA